MNINRIFSAFALFVFSSVLIAQSNDPVLMKIAGVDVKRSEFEYAYNKNNTGQNDTEYPIEEYLPMFVNFKLKVAEAKAQKLDTLTSFRQEYEKDRAALAEEYLTDKDYIELEAYRIYSKDSATIGKDGFVNVMHIAVPVSQKATPAEVAEAKAKIDTAYVMLQSGKSFEEAAAYVGMPPMYMKPFEIIRGQVYEEFEKAAYSLADGEYSAPFKSPAAFHVVKRISSRPFGSFEQYKKPIMNMLEKENIQKKARLKKGSELAKAYGGNITPEEALAREDSMLESKYPEFGNLMREYYEGLLFFEVSNREVWNKDADEEKQLAKFFKKNKKKYKFDLPRFRGAVVYTKTQELLDSVKTLLAGKSKDEYRAIVTDSFAKEERGSIRLELGIYAVGDNKWVDKLVFGQGAGGEVKEKLPFVDVVGKVIEAPEVYTDVKAAVTDDYNKAKEEKWVKKLRRKYDVEIYEEVLKTVNNHD